MSRRSLVVCVVVAAAAMVALVMFASRPADVPYEEPVADEPSSSGTPEFTPLPGPQDGAPAVDPETPDPRGTGAESGRVAEATKTGAIRGVVRDERGDAVSPAVVMFDSCVIRVHQGEMIGDPPSTRSDRAGRFEVELPVGQEYRILVFAPGYAQSSEVKASAGGPEVEIRVRRIPAIFGTVVDDATSDQVDRAALLLQKITPTGEPSPDAARGYKAEGGEFTLTDLAPTRYRLTVTVAGYDAWKSDEIVLSKEQPHARVTARVSRSGVWGSINVTLLSPDGTPVTKLNRAILHHPETGFLAMTGLGVATPFRLEAPEGRQVLQIQADGFLPDVRAVEVPGNDVAEIEITLKAAGHVKVVVTDGEGKPATDYRLRILDAEGAELEYDLRITEPAVSGQPKPEEPLQGTVGKNQLMPGGEITLKNLAPGRYRLEATREGLSPAAQDFDVEAAGTVEVKLTLR